MSIEISSAPTAAASPAGVTPRRRQEVAATVHRSTSWDRLKHAIDVFGAAILLLALGPPLALIALSIRGDTRGPVLFRQERYGRGRRRFVVLEFRTMHDGVSPDVHRSYIARLARTQGAAAQRLKKLTSDPRVTRVGAFLRRISLDELPQLVNVLRGEMSIVGPRPALPYELEYYGDDHYARFDVRPGLTGLWQVSGRNELGFLDMLSLDAEYARTSSPRVDAMIPLRTPPAPLRGNAA